MRSPGFFLPLPVKERILNCVHYGQAARQDGSLALCHSRRERESDMIVSMKFAGSLTAVIMLALLSATVLAGQKDQRKEEGEDHFRKWLNEDVFYIITQDEREIFEKLSTPEEKENFIEQFWVRRDPDGRTAVNEFKEEHYRRIAYANERFHSGIPGWKTDRGRIYILYGEPDEISGKPAGGMHVRSPYEGGGTTSVFPFETWRYNYIEGIGNDVEIEFVDPHQSGEFRLARDPQEKDALLYIPNAGLTLSEAAGATDKRDRILTRNLANQVLNSSNPYTVFRSKDQPFERLLRQAQLERPPVVRFKDLETVVRSQVSYQSLPYQLKIHFVRVGGADVLAPLTIQIPNRELGYQQLPNGTHRAAVQLYGEVWDIGKRLVYNFEDELLVEHSQDQFSEGLRLNSIHQRYIPLKPGRFIVKLVIKDSYAGKVSTADQLIVVPSFPDDRLSASSIILADAIIPEESGDDPGMFSLGGFKIIPSVDSIYDPSDYVFVYFQLYKVALDQQSLQPNLKFKRSIRGLGDSSLAETLQPRIASFTDNRVVVVDYIPAKDLPRGGHTLEYEVEDLTDGKTLKVSSRFTVSGKSDS